MKQQLFLLLILSSCTGKEIKQAEQHSQPRISDNGRTIQIPDTGMMCFFATERISDERLPTTINAMGTIGVTILASTTGAGQNIVLFDNPELAGNYAQLIQHQNNIRQIQYVSVKQRQIELERTVELQLHGAATGQDLLNAQTALSMEQSNLANERASLMEQETKLKSGGFDPERLLKAKAGTAYIICDIPENQIGAIREQQPCDINFTAFPSEKFRGKIDAVADIVDHATRMVKVRVTVSNSCSKLKSGMYANLSFGLTGADFVSISKTSLVTVQGKNYVFVKTSATGFERREIQAGQQIANRVVVLAGLSKGDEIAQEGVIQLKGLSFGY